VLKKHGVGLHQAVLSKLFAFPKGRILDVGTGKGELATKLIALGYDVAVCDIALEPPWTDQPKIDYKQCDLNLEFPFPDESFDFVVCLEVIEHVENPFALCRQLKRILRRRGRAIVSTPNILNIKSRVRFLLEGNYEFFKYPPIEWEQDGAGANVHVNPIRLHEMEYYFYKSGFEVEEIFTSQRSYGWRLMFPLELFVRFQTLHKIKRSQRPGEIPLARIYSHILTDDLMYGEHLIACVLKP